MVRGRAILPVRGISAVQTVRDGKLPENVCIPLRVPLTLVNTIENAGDRGGTLAKHAFETEAVLGCLEHPF